MLTNCIRDVVTIIRSTCCVQNVKLYNNACSRYNVNIYIICGKMWCEFILMCHNCIFINNSLIVNIYRTIASIEVWNKLKLIGIFVHGLSIMKTRKNRYRFLRDTRNIFCRNFIDRYERFKVFYESSTSLLAICRTSTVCIHHNSIHRTS